MDLTDDELEALRAAVACARDEGQGSELDEAVLDRLAAQRRAWTREPPTRPGWYWLRWTGIGGVDVVVKVDGGALPRAHFVGGESNWLPMRTIRADAEWFGPLEPPR
jgi:hypothetical protein